jgi:dynein intermediate chain 1
MSLSRQLHTHKPFHTSTQIEVPCVPEDQIKELTAEQKNEVFTKIITATDPNVSKAVTRFHYREGVFKLDPGVDNLAVHFRMDGILVHKDSDEAAAQHSKNAESGAAKTKTTAVAQTGDGDEAKEGESGDSSTSTSTGTSTGADSALKNQFNFSDRSSQTFNNPMRDREVSTEPPPTASFGANITQWEIFDTYLADLEQQAAEKESKTQKSQFAVAAATEEDEPVAVVADNEQAWSVDDVLNSSDFALAVQTMERMVTQNAEAECFHDYKYYEVSVTTVASVNHYSPIALLPHTHLLIIFSFFFSFLYSSCLTK